MTQTEICLTTIILISILIIFLISKLLREKEKGYDNLYHKYSNLKLENLLLELALIDKNSDLNKAEAKYELDLSPAILGYLENYKEKIQFDRPNIAECINVTIEEIKRSTK